MIMTTLEEFDQRRSILRNLRPIDATARLAEFLAWMERQELTKGCIEEIRSKSDINALISVGPVRNPPVTSTLEEVAAVGIWLMQECKNGKSFF
jgi:hypothetical protein